MLNFQWTQRCYLGTLSVPIQLEWGLRAHTHLPADTSEHTAGQQRSPGLAGIPVTAPKPEAAVRPPVDTDIMLLLLVSILSRLCKDWHFFLHWNQIHFIWYLKTTVLICRIVHFAFQSLRIPCFRYTPPSPNPDVTHIFLSLLAGAEHALHLLALLAPRICRSAPHGVWVDPFPVLLTWPPRTSTLACPSRPWEHGCLYVLPRELLPGSARFSRRPCEIWVCMDGFPKALLRADYKGLIPAALFWEEKQASERWQLHSETSSCNYCIWCFPAYNVQVPESQPGAHKTILAFYAFLLMLFYFTLLEKNVKIIYWSNN